MSHLAQNPRRRKSINRRFEFIEPTEPDSIRRGKLDSMLLCMLFMLLIAGTVVLFAASFYNSQDKGNPLDVVIKQMLGVGVGCVALFVAANIDYRIYKRPAFVFGLLTTSILLLVLVAIPSIGKEINGSRRWLYIGTLSFQPSELAKFAMVLFVSKLLSQMGDGIKSLIKGIIPVMVVPGIMFLLILEQPNLSTAGTIVIVAMLLVVVAGARWLHLGIMGLAGAAAATYYAWSEPYRRARLLSFRDPFAKLSNEGYQLSQSLLAFGSGGWFGMGLGMGRQKYAFLPYPASDFIFAVVGEDLGFVGCVGILLMFLLFIWLGFRVSMNCADRFGAMLACGITAMIAVQTIINVAVVIGLVPTTGLPLPFFSEGGTSIAIFMAAVGVLLNISRYSEMAN